MIEFFSSCKALKYSRLSYLYFSLSLSLSLACHIFFLPTSNVPQFHIKGHNQSSRFLPLFLPQNHKFPCLFLSLSLFLWKHTSINQFSRDLQGTPWWTQQQQQRRQQMETTQEGSSSSKQKHKITPTQQQFWPSHHHQSLYQQHQLWLNSYNSPHESPSIFPQPTFSFNLNQEDKNDEQELEEQTLTASREQEPEIEKEPMFEKPLTPSDVGKLNRLVIPKQHAEKYFPLGGDSGVKGLLLSFEDESGKCWGFRYSYWNSSQSYVLTKGWSRYVKEKRLEAGDIILFKRHRIDSERLFIGWRRHGTASVQDADNGGGGGGSGGGWSRGFYSGHPYPVDVVQSHGLPIPYQPDCIHAGSVVQNQTTPVGNSKTLRLFGVNLECQQLDESEPSTPNGSTLWSLGQAHQQYIYSQAYNSSNRPNLMDFTFSREGVNQMMRNRQG